MHSAKAFKYRKISFGEGNKVINLVIQQFYDLDDILDKIREECRAGFAIFAIFLVIASYRPLGLNKKST